MLSEYTQYWFWLCKLGERKNQACKVLAKGKLNSWLIEFEDGFRTLTSRNAVRRRWYLIEEKRYVETD